MHAQKPKPGAAGVLGRLLPDTDKPPMARVSCAVAMAEQPLDPGTCSSLQPAARSPGSLVFPPILSAGRP